MFFSFPHIGIDDSGEVGAISRPGRPKVSHACGALLKALGEVKNEGVGRNFSIPGGFVLGKFCWGWFYWVGFLPSG